MLLKYRKKYSLYAIIILLPIVSTRICIDSNTIKIRDAVINLESKGTCNVNGQINLIHISDLHLKKVNKTKRSIIKKINSLKPDVICITGDLIDYPIKSMVNLKQSLDLLNELNPTLGTYAILGNTDLPYKDSIIEYLKTTNIRVLFNEIENISFKGHEFDLVGLFYINNSDTAYRQLIQRPLHSNTIILSHSPDIIYQLNNTNENIKLVLSGHTHAGQIRIPDLGAILLPSKCEDDGYHFYDLSWFSDYNDIQYGYLRLNNAYLSVSSGLNVGSPRFFSTNEIVRIKVFYQNN